MATDEPSHAPPEAPARLQRPLEGNVGSRDREVDEHMFTVEGQPGDRPGTFRLQLFTGAGLRPVAVATRSVDEYPSLANAAERYAESVWERYLPTDPPPPIWVENPTCDGMNATPAIVEFTVSDDRRLVDPQWNWLEPGDLAMLVVSASWEGVPGSAV